MPLSQPTISCSFHAKDLFKFVIHNSYTLPYMHIIPFMPLYNNPINYMPNIKRQERKHQTSAYPHSAPRSGRKGLAQARRILAQGSSPSPRRELDKTR